MGLGEPGNFLWGSGTDEFIEHLASTPVTVLDLGSELAVAPGPGPALAKLDVGVRVEGTAGHERGNFFAASFNRVAPLKEYGIGPGLCEGEGGKEAGGTGPDDERRAIEAAKAGRETPAGFAGKGVKVLEVFLWVLFERKANPVHHADIALVARIDALFFYGKALKLVRAAHDGTRCTQLEALKGLFPGGKDLVERERDLVEAVFVHDPFYWKR